MENLQLIKNCLEVRKKTITKSLLDREQGKQDFSDWGHCSKEELTGRYMEIKNTLDMINAYLG